MTLTKDTKYIGSDHRFDDLNAIALKHIDGKLLLEEAPLYRTKWFDYRRLTPTKATYLFVHYYNEAFGHFIRTAIDRKLQYTKAIKGGDLFLQKEGKGHLNRVAFWKLRMRADRMGVRYDFFCRAAMNHFIDEGWVNVPRPSHVDDDVVGLAILDRWHHECAAKIQWASHPHYKTANFTGDLDQLDYQAWITQQMRSRSVPRFSLHTALYERDALRIEHALLNFSPEDIEWAADECR